MSVVTFEDERCNGLSKRAASELELGAEAGDVPLGFVLDLSRSFEELKWEICLDRNCKSNNVRIHDFSFTKFPLPLIDS